MIIPNKAQVLNEFDKLLQLLKATETDDIRYSNVDGLYSTTHYLCTTRVCVSVAVSIFKDYVAIEKYSEPLCDFRYKSHLERTQTTPSSIGCEEFVFCTNDNGENCWKSENMTCTTDELYTHVMKILSALEKSHCDKHPNWSLMQFV